MKYLLKILIALAFSNEALACVQSDSQAESKLIGMFQVAGKPVDWVSVKIKKNSETKEITLFNNRSFPVTVFATSRINSSKIQYKRDSYDLRDAKVCYKENKILIVHPKGELTVSRRGNSLLKAEVLLRQNGGLFKLRLRPKKLVHN